MKDHVHYVTPSPKSERLCGVHSGRCTFDVTQVTCPACKEIEQYQLDLLAATDLGTSKPLWNPNPSDVKAYSTIDEIRQLQGYAPLGEGE